MTVYLLDANMLIAAIDTGHKHHQIATQWFGAHRLDGWATCPLTENAALRIIGNPRYENTMGTPAAVLPYLIDLVQLPTHHFWSDDISLADDKIMAGAITHHDHITDRYLVALASAHGGVLATFDRRIGVNTPAELLRHVQVIDA